MENTWLDFPVIALIAGLFVFVVSVVARYLPPPSVQQSFNQRIKELSARVDEQNRRLIEQEGVIKNLGRQYREALEEAAEVNRIARVQAQTINDLRSEVAQLKERLGLQTMSSDLYVLGIWPFPEIDLNTTVEETAIYNSGFAYRGLREQEATKEGIVLELRRHPYTLLEIGSHGTRDGIQLYNDIARPGWWMRLFSEFSSLQAVLLLACVSDEIGDALLAAGVPIVVSMQREVKDEHVGVFVKNFYSYLSNQEYLAAHNLTNRPDQIEKAVEFSKNLIPERAGATIRVRRVGQA